MRDQQEILKLFGQYIKTVRQEKGLTLLDVEVATGISEGALSKIENGKKNLTLPTVLKLAVGLKVHPSSLLHIFDD